MPRQAFQQGDHFLPFQELCLGWRYPLGGDSHHLVRRVQHLRHPGGEVGEEGPQRCQALVACPDVIASLLLQMLQEGQCLGHRQVFHTKSGDRPAQIGGHEDQEEPHGIAVALD